MTMPRSRLLICLTIRDAALSPAEISLATGIRPTEAFRRGERDARLVLPRTDMWTVETDHPSEVLADHWEDLGHIVVPKRDALRDIVATGSGTMTIAVYDSSIRCPPLGIPSSMSRFAGYINVDIDVDHMQ
jgi:hypothetical protein